MSSCLFNNLNGPFANVVDGFVYPQFLTANRAPTSQDIYPPGTRWIDLSVNPRLIYETSGAGDWDTGGVQPATTTTYGTVLLTDNNEPVATKFYADNLAIAGATDASQVTKGISYLATNADVVSPYPTPLGANTVLTPANITTIFASPPPTGGTTPGAGSFTTLAASGLASLSGSATILTAGTDLNLATDADTAAVNIGTGAATRTITIGENSAATAIVLTAGTGGISMTSAGAGDITLASSDTLLLDSAGVLELNSSAGVISVGNDAVNLGINIGTAGTRPIIIGNSTATTSVSINGGTGSSVNIGTNAIAHIVSIGNVTGNTAVAIDSGTGAINVGTSIAKIITIGNVTGTTSVNINTGTNGSAYTTTNGPFTLATGTGNINISNDAAATTVNLATGGGIKATTIGSTNATSTTTLQSGSGALNVTATGGALTINSGIGALGISTDASATTVNIGTGTAVVKTISIGGTGANVIAIGNTQTAGSVTIGNAMITGTIQIGGSGAQTGTITIAGGTGAQTVNIANSTGGKTVAIATGAGTNVVSLGSTDTASSLTLRAGTGNFSLDGAATTIYTFAPSVTSGTINFGGTGANTGTATVFGGTGAQTINIANSTGGKTVAIATGAGANTVTLGSTDTTSTTTIKAGSGKVNLVGNVALTTPATQLQVHGGAVTDFIGAGVLTLGTVTIANTNIAATDRIFLSRLATNGSVTLGEYTYTISAGASFTVTSVILGTPASTQTADVSSFAYFIVRQI